MSLYSAGEYNGTKEGELEVYNDHCIERRRIRLVIKKQEKEEFSFEDKLVAAYHRMKIKEKVLSFESKNGED